MVAGGASSISVTGDGNVVAGRDVNVGSSVNSIDFVPLQYRAEFLAVEKLMKSAAAADIKRERARTFGRELSVAGFGAVAGAVMTHLLAMI